MVKWLLNILEFWYSNLTWRLNAKCGVRGILFAGLFLCCWLVVRIRLTSCANHHNIYLRDFFLSMNTTVNHSNRFVLTCCGHVFLGIGVLLFLVFVLVACPTARKILNDVLYV